MSGAPRLHRRPDIAIPSECRELIHHGTLMAINHSGGKDSQCMTILLSRLVPREQILIIHAPLGEVEWPGTSMSTTRFRTACRSFSPPRHPGNPCSNASRSEAGFRIPGDGIARRTRNVRRSNASCAAEGAFPI